jgi:hypothetical protein
MRMSWGTTLPGPHCPAHHPRFCGVLLTLVGVGLILFGLVPAMQCNNSGACGQFNDAFMGPGIAVAIAATLLVTIGPLAMLIGGTARGGRCVDAFNRRGCGGPPASSPSQRPD